MLASRISQMKAQNIQQVDAPHQFEPLLPSDAAMAPLLERASDLARACHALAVNTATGAQPALRRLLRSMNAYDTNRLEGEHTRPSDIELALQQDFSTNADLARRQRLAVAHIHTEEACEAALARRLAADGETAARWLYSPDALTWLHQALFSGLPAADLLLADGSAMVPGQFRQRGVDGGRHEAPTWASLPLFLARWQAADEHRRGSLDGRGNLTQAGLVDWIGYTLDICINQVAFMARQLDVQGMRGRIHAALAHEVAVARSGVRLEALNALHYLFATQAELGRADFKTMTGLGERVATATISALLARGFVTTDSPYGALRFGVPRHALRFYFPALWPEAEQDEGFLSGAVGLPVVKARRPG